VKGFVYRDFGGILMHRSTLRDQGFDVNWMHPNGRILTDDLEFIWQQTHHTVIQCHIGNMLHALDLEKLGGWGMVREELTKAVSCLDSNEERNELLDYMTKEYMDTKCFLEMRIKDTRLVSDDISIGEPASQPADILGNHEKGPK
jgi:siderophore synthetase component